MKKNILYISSNFNYACGVSKNVFAFLTSKELRKEFNLHFITNGGDALDKLHKSGIIYSKLNFKTDNYFHLDLSRNIKLLSKYCEENRIDIIHSHHRYPEFLSNRIKKKLDVKTVITVHNFTKGLKKISYKSNAVISVSNAVKDHLINYFDIKSDKITVLYNCVSQNITSSFDKTKLKKQLGIPERNFVIFYAGKLINQKGINILIESFRIISKEKKNVSLLLVGDADDRKLLIKDKNLFALKSQEDISNYYQISDLVILPSINEALGYTMLEAGLYKIPFIGARCGGIAEFINDGVNGFLFEPGNEDDLATKINYILDNPEQSKNSADNLNTKVRDLCDCGDYFKKMKQIYFELLED